MEENDKIKVPVEIPQSVVEKLSQDCGYFSEIGDSIGSSFFVASAMDLNNDGQKDFVIQLVGSTDGCILGAHSTLFWIFVHTSKGYKMVFKKTGQWLNVSKKEINGYKNISISTAVRLVTMIGIDYRYNKNQYTPHRCFSYSIDESSDDHSVRYEKCSIKSIE